MGKQITTAILGLGGRGRDCYGQYVLDNSDKIKVVAVADLIREKVDKAKRDFNLDESMCFNSDKELFSQERLADSVLICTQDKDHVEHAIEAIEKGYHILLEKPISPDIDECRKLLKIAKEHGRHIIVCHVLRYTPFYGSIKRVIDSGKIGEVVTIQAIEKVAYWHQAHSFVRGNWRRADESSPMILAKCCHDVDILLWLADKKCKRVSSYGSNYLFNKDKAPEGAPKRCTDGCVHEAECPYSALKIYMENKETGIKHGHTWWPTNIVALNPTEESVLEGLKEGPYGRCVYHCDNDVVDHQVLNLDLEDGVTINFTMSAFTDKCYREIKVMGTMGCIEGNMDTNEIWYSEFGKERQVVDITVDGESLAGHGGGDFIMMDQFVELLAEEKEMGMMTAIEKSIESHVVALLAEESRVNGGKSIEIKD